MLKINIDEIGGGLTLRESYPATAFAELDDMQAAGELTFTQPLEFELTLKRLDKVVTIDGRLKGETRMVCGHCLNDCELAFESEFSLKAVPEPAHALAFAAETELGDGDFDEVCYCGNTLDLHDILQEQVLLALPLAPLCREDCKGLCPQCGHDLNLGECGCKRVSGHSAFADLAGLSFKE